MAIAHIHERIKLTALLKQSKELRKEENAPAPLEAVHKAKQEQEA